MAKLKWKVIHDCDDDEGNVTCWSTEINHPRYGKYAWISDNGTFDVEVEQSDDVISAQIYEIKRYAGMTVFMMQ